MWPQICSIIERKKWLQLLDNRVESAPKKSRLNKLSKKWRQLFMPHFFPREGIPKSYTPRNFKNSQLELFIPKLLTHVACCMGRGFLSEELTAILLQYLTVSCSILEHLTASLQPHACISFLQFWFYLSYEVVCVVCAACAVCAARWDILIGLRVTFTRCSKGRYLVDTDDI